MTMAGVKKKILIVDDEEDLTWSIAKGLSRESDLLEIICANSGSMALEICRKHAVDLLVTDMRMPGMSGSELIKRVKDHYPKIKVIIMSAYSQTEERDGHNGKFLPVIEKPFEIHELRNMINKYLHFS